MRQLLDAHVCLVVALYFLVFAVDGILPVFDGLQCVQKLFLKLSESPHVPLKVLAHLLVSSFMLVVLQP